MDELNAGGRHGDKASMAPSRFVAQELNLYKVEGISQGIPCLDASAFGYAARSVNGVVDKLIARYDTSGILPCRFVRRHCSDPTEDVVIWKLTKAMNVTRGVKLLGSQDSEH